MYFLTWRILVLVTIYSNVYGMTSQKMILLRTSWLTFTNLVKPSTFVTSFNGRLTRHFRLTDISPKLIPMNKCVQWNVFDTQSICYMYYYYYYYYGCAASGLLFSVSWSYTQSAGILGRGISLSQGLCLLTGQHKPNERVHASMLEWDSNPRPPPFERQKTFHAQTARPLWWVLFNHSIVLNADM
jgi:hypothetical protein